MEYIINVNPKEASVLEEFLNKMKIRFTKSAEEISVVAEEPTPYNAEFIAKIQQGEKDLAEGKTRKLDLDNLWK